MMCADCGLAPAERLARFVTMVDEITRLGPDPPAYVYKNLAYALGQLFSARPEVRDKLVGACRSICAARRGTIRSFRDRDNLVKLGVRVSD